MRKFVAIALMLALFSGGLEFASDYGEAFERTTLAALPDGHSSDDGHAPADHGQSCDSCHFGGVHLIAFVTSLPAAMPPATTGFGRWVAQDPAKAYAAPPNPPPIA